MKVVILAGGFGTRISEESHLKPKPMIEIGEKPILWHIMKMYSHYGFNEFVICCGYKQHVIKEWFADYYLHNSDITFDFTQENKMIVHNTFLDPWKVTLVDTGLNTMTGGRIKRVREYLEDDTFMLTYGDGVADIDIPKLLEYHKSHGKMATITAKQVGYQIQIVKGSLHRSVQVCDIPHINLIRSGCYMCGDRAMHRLHRTSSMILHSFFSQHTIEGGF